jgi:hypothetical protein
MSAVTATVWPTLRLTGNRPPSTRGRTFSTMTRRVSGAAAADFRAVLDAALLARVAPRGRAVSARPARSVLGSAIGDRRHSASGLDCPPREHAIDTATLLSVVPLRK